MPEPRARSGQTACYQETLTPERPQHDLSQALNEPSQFAPAVTLAHLLRRVLLTRRTATFARRVTPPRDTANNDTAQIESVPLCPRPPRPSPRQISRLRPHQPLGQTTPPPRRLSPSLASPRSEDPATPVHLGKSPHPLRERAAVDPRPTGTRSDKPAAAGRRGCGPRGRSGSCSTR